MKIEFKEQFKLEGVVIKKSRIIYTGNASIPRLEMQVESTLKGKPYIYKTITWGRKAYHIKKKVKVKDVVMVTGRPTKNNHFDPPLFYITLDTCRTQRELEQSNELSKMFE